jgi:hypothetical protein
MSAFATVTVTWVYPEAHGGANVLFVFRVFAFTQIMVVVLLKPGNPKEPAASAG